MLMEYRNVKIKVLDGDMSENEIKATVDEFIDSHSDKAFYSITFSVVDDNYVDVSYTTVPVQRIRRITGYLVGTLDRFNDSKRAEESDRVKHSLD